MRVRHDRIVRHLSSLVQRAGGVSYVEPRYLDDVDRKRPDIHAFFPDDRIMLDVCVAHSAAPSYSRVSSPGFALRIRETEKVSAYSALAAKMECRFVPFVFESFGTIGSFALRFIQDLSSYAKESFSDWSATEALSSLSVRKGNAGPLISGCLMLVSLTLCGVAHGLFL